MVMTTREQILLDTQRTRAQAAEILKELQEAKCQCEQALAADKRQDMIKQVTGQSSLESAITETRRVLESLDRAIEEAVKDLDEDDRDVVGLEGLEAVVTAGRLALRGRMADVRTAV